MKPESNVEYVNANSNTPLSESLLNGDDDEEFDDVLLENALRQLDLSSICKEKESAKASTISEPLSGVRSGNANVNNPFAKSVSSAKCVSANSDTPLREPREDDDDLDLELAKLNLSGTIVESNG
jgi:hypothetical protein